MTSKDNFIFSENDINELKDDNYVKWSIGHLFSKEEKDAKEKRANNNKAPDDK